MPQVSGRFGPYPLNVILDGSGNGQVAFQAVGANVRITNGFVRVSTAIQQASCTAYKGLVGDSYAISSTQSGSTGAPLTGPFDLLDGETLILRWTGGDAGATATATLTGIQLPFDQIGESQISWEDPIAAADGTLIYPAIKSPDYVAGVTGWAINRDGSVEFNDAVVRGELDVISPSGAFIRTFVDTNVAQILLQPPDSSTPGVVFGAANIWCQVSAVDRPFLVLEGPSVEAPSFLGTGSIYIGADSALSQTAIEVLAQEVVIGASDYPSSTQILSPPIRVGPDAGDIGRGLVAYVGDTGNSAAIGATETAVLTTAVTTFRAGRAYRVKLAGRLACSVANSAPVLRIRKTNATGASLATIGRVACISTGEFAVPNGDYVFVVGANDVAAAICFCLTGSATFTVAHQGIRWLTIWDVTEEPDYVDATVLT